MDYKIVSARHPSTLEGLVYLYMKEGWKPHGGICSTNVNHEVRAVEELNYSKEYLVVKEERLSNSIWTQAMIKD